MKRLRKRHVSSSKTEKGNDAAFIFFFEPHHSWSARWSQLALWKEMLRSKAGKNPQRADGTCEYFSHWKNNHPSKTSVSFAGALRSRWETWTKAEVNREEEEGRDGSGISLVWFQWRKTHKSPKINKFTAIKIHLFELKASLSWNCWPGVCLNI